MKQSSLDDHESIGMELGGIGSDNTDEVELSEFDERRPANASNENNQMYNFQNRPQSPIPTPVPIPRGFNSINNNYFNIQEIIYRTSVETKSTPERYRYVFRECTFKICGIQSSWRSYNISWFTTTHP